MVQKTLNDFYMNLSRKDKYHVKVRNKIVTECKISTTIFYNWLKGLTSVPHWARPIIAEIMDVPLSELFPEDNL
jgi:hypothetical protein